MEVLRNFPAFAVFAFTMVPLASIVGQVPKSAMKLPPIIPESLCTLRNLGQAVTFGVGAATLLKTLFNVTNNRNEVWEEYI